MLGIYYLLFFIFIFQKSYAQCPQQANGVFRFGPKCGFMCHCRNNVKCDDTTGECTSGCASFWYGPGCQYRDIAEGEYSRHSDNLPHGKHKYSALANDGDKNTCSYTAEVQSSEKKVKPFWRVWFPTNETIWELEIVTLNATLQYFKGFTVFVEYLSPEEKESQNASSYRRECYKHGDAAPNNATFIVPCTSPVVGNQVRIVLDELKTQLVLCDVRINGGRNLAYGRTTSQISKHRDCRKDDTCSSDKAVDGNESNKYWTQCTLTADKSDPWLKIELDHKTTIWYIRILLQKVETSTYQLEVSNATNEVGKSTYDVNATASLQINLTLNTIGESVKLTKRTTLGRLEICEVYIYGDCLEDKCGYGCGHECHCKRATIWNKMSRSCSYGCKDGWMSSGCNIRINCLNETDGDKCSGCSEHCKDGHIPCNKADGSCSKGCNDGWKGQKCDQECDDGTFGSGCSQACSGHCKNDQPCDKANGSCPNGCSKGYEGSSCNQTCPAGFYGDNCNSNCSENCVEGTCRHEDGICTKGCIGGWKGIRCEKQCNHGTYGHNCSMNCSRNCNNDDICKKDDGICPHGCKEGFRGDRCDQRCGSGQYGTNCSRKCSENCENECDHINGHCKCKAGWMGQTCEQECIDGKYGFYCRVRCNGNCKNGEICEKVDGSCPNGCKPGYYGKLCSQSCSTGYYGINCTSKCSEHCKGGYSACSKENGNCRLGCNAGWNGTKCDQECNGGTYGHNCSMNCSRNCKNNDQCKKDDGICPNGCKKGFRGDRCDQPCPVGFYGNSCKNTCSENCVEGTCRHEDGKCIKGCTAGWKGKRCAKQCNDGTYGPDCSMDCSGNCKNDVPCKKDDGICPNGCNIGLRGERCDQRCRSGQYGTNCSRKCSEHCENKCNHINGHCRCKAGWMGQTCEQECDRGWFGQGCQYRCSENCKDDNICDTVNGQCPRGCKPGYTGKTCAQNCTAGFYGDKCSHNCSGHCEGGSIMCSSTDGDCLGGCEAGWNGAKCDTGCDNGNFGPDCLNTCSLNCYEDDICDKVHGQCPRGCKPGFTGNTCEQNCKIGFYGDKCSHNCSGHCEGGSKMCSIIDGHCLGGCEAGWKGTQCDTECDGGFYGINCSMTCGNCKSGTVCHKVVGTCSEGCESGYSGDNCLQAMQKSNNSVAITAGGVAALVIFMAIAAAIIVVIYRKRKKPGQRKSDDSANIEFTDAVSSGRCEKDRQKRCNNMHLNAAAASNAETNRSSTSGVNTYNNDPSVSQTKHTVPLSNLLAYVKRNLANSDYFSKEFQELPYGMKYPSTVGANPYNRKKNRYKDMQAYNHTRVMLKTLPKEQGSDYINASFIKGHAKEKAYIAAQGPTETTIDDFWRMIWEKNVYTIAMVTNLVEETKTKCLQYWPTVESSTRYGDFIVRTESEAIFAEFTIRNLKVDFEEGKPSRTITQFHFTAWPDHSVPRSTSGLLQFWRKVRNNDANKAHSWLVHCSAGVGRTGTFIATDILYDQGKDKGYVDVYQCVRDLRDQRVSMVQTKDQYLFLHGLMIEAFILPSEPVPLEHFHQVLNDLKDVDKVARKTKLLLQYETLKEDMTYMFTKDETEEKYSAAMLKENRTKNRNNSILPPNEFRPFLATAIAGCTNYINAVYIPSYCDILGYIITQTPLESTAIDCCRLVYEQEVKVIVTFPAKVKEQDGTYLPEDSTVNLGPFTVAKTSEEDKHFYKKKTFVMAYDSEECELTQLMFNNWPVNRITPSDTLNMLNFMQEVEFHRRIADNKPVLVQCLDGSEKSGLFVVLMNILERARLDNEVSIPQVIRQLRIRRQQIIPNFEQFKFCHDVLLCHVDSNAMYANM